MCMKKTFLWIFKILMWWWFPLWYVECFAMLINWSYDAIQLDFSFFFYHPLLNRFKFLFFFSKISVQLVRCFILQWKIDTNEMLNLSYNIEMNVSYLKTNYFLDCMPEKRKFNIAVNKEVVQVICISVINNSNYNWHWHTGFITHKSRN